MIQFIISHPYVSLILAINLAINIFIVGGFWSHEFRWARSKTELRAIVLQMFIGIFIGFEFLIGVFLWDIVIVPFWKWFSALTGITFYWKFYLTRYYDDDMTPDTMQKMWNMCHIIYKKRPVFKKLWMKRLGMVYKRHNFTPETNAK